MMFTAGVDPARMAIQSALENLGFKIIVQGHDSLIINTTLYLTNCLIELGLRGGNSAH